ncbi:MAG: bifunctional glutamate N-acetyltransferase/amino-acid acetyltransferase ArgJ [Chloroflexota bacterium]|nr:bifunctional glutamate N-acetyltransferase/amino-acid acetyltransferase ArgJ [Chloroflexota bacterium]
MTEAIQPALAVTGFHVAGVHCGLKADGALDFALISSDRPCAAAGVFTTNQVKAAPVLYDQDLLAANGGADVRAIAVNTRCANACTGELGLANAAETARLTAERLGVPLESVLVMSTGVIGTQMPMDKIARGIDLAAAALASDDDAWHTASRGIMTTDTRPKIASTDLVEIIGGSCRITGIAKGAGMIAPNMATMLGFIVTDAALTPEQAGRLLRGAVEVSFNRIVVDGDTSTNDSVFLLANGASDLILDTPELEAQFAHALTQICVELAQSVVRDGEGATKFITIEITGAPDDTAAKQIANAIGTSPLVKTAFYGGDANWGRIIAAAGRSGVAVDPARMQLRFAATDDAPGLLLFDAGMPTHYDETAATALAQGANIVVRLDLGQGDGSALIWTCDLTHDYVSINGHYRS